ncbi:MAG: nucleotide sugar dehydrogenase, partial [Acidobacteriaceae bacterium]|nr:nucleotide sugar dehydrogenase [Acidobacteriaceae bacterium]
RMPEFVVDKIQNALNDHSKPVRGSHVHILGAAYKRDIDDVRESPALDIMLLLRRRGAHLTFSDTYVPSLRLDGTIMQSQEPLSSAEKADCVVIVTDHRNVDYAKVLDRSKLVVDTRNALKGYKSDKIVRL